MSQVETPAALVRRAIRDSFDGFPDAPPGPVQPCGPFPPGVLTDPVPNMINPDQDWIEIVLVDQAGQPAIGVLWRITTADGQVYEGRLDETGSARLDGITPGQAVVTFPEMDRRLWSAD